MSSPYPPVGGAGVRESVSGQLNWAHDTAAASPSVAQCVTCLPGLLLTVAFFLDAAELCACWTPPLTAEQRDKIATLLRAPANQCGGDET
jgi:hypothetical protein